MVVANPLETDTDIRMEIQIASGGVKPSPLNYKIQCKDYKRD